MFIDNLGNLQFSSIEELIENKEIAIKEIQKWEIPTVEAIEEQIANSINEYVQLTEMKIDIEVLESIFSSIKMGFDIAQEIIDQEIQNEEISRKFTSYTNKSCLACEDLKSKLFN